jgi:hypothetical protein
VLGIVSADVPEQAAVVGPPGNDRAARVSAGQAESGPIQSKSTFMHVAGMAVVAVGLKDRLHIPDKLDCCRF